MDTDLWTVAEAAQRARVSEKVLYRRIRAGEVPAIRVGDRGKILVPRRAFLKWLFGADVDDPRPTPQ